MKALGPVDVLVPRLGVVSFLPSGSRVQGRVGVRVKGSGFGGQGLGLREDCGFACTSQVFRFVIVKGNQHAA